MAREMVDYVRDENEDLLIAGGDLVRGECTYKHQRDLLLSSKGEYKATPMVCVDVNSYLDNDDKDAVRSEIVKQFNQDGMVVEDLTPNPDAVSDNTVTVFPQAYYK